MTSVPRLKLVEREEWKVDIYTLEVEWDHAARSNRAAFLRRQIESAQADSSPAPGAPGERLPVNRILIDERLLDSQDPPSVCRLHHCVVPSHARSTWGVGP